MAQEYPDPSTPWLSTGEMVAAMSERGWDGQKRYESDEAFRSICESKTGKGFETHSGPSISTGKPQNQVVIGSEDFAKGVEIVRLRSEIKELKGLELQAAVQQIIDAQADGRGADGGPTATAFGSKSEMQEWYSHPAYKSGDPGVVRFVESRTDLTDAAALE